jgi:hypothetical protein
MELAQFPYDHQQLELIIRMPHNKDKGRRFTHYYKKLNKIKPLSIALAEWDLFQPEVHTHYIKSTRTTRTTTRTT